MSKTMKTDLNIRELTAQLNQAQNTIKEYQSQMNANPLKELTGVLTKLLDMKQESIKQRQVRDEMIEHKLRLGIEATKLD